MENAHKDLDYTGAHALELSLEVARLFLMVFSELDHVVDCLNRARETVVSCGCLASLLKNYLQLIMFTNFDIFIACVILFSWG